MPTRKRRKSSIWDGIVDFAFANFITPQIVRAQWAMCVIIAVVVLALLVCGNAIAVIIFLRDENHAFGLLIGLVVSDLLVPLILWGWLLTVRLILEAIIVHFRSEEHLRLLANKTRVIPRPNATLPP
ncbi:MAG TPA: DUF4282 domain-containing protein [Pirellulales bacterium]|jgi:hypothetical protein|nr:DUF4282 domain-containing protein [Pirellulales bacterium]